jgi:hypothetical protein
MTNYTRYHQQALILTLAEGSNPTCHQQCIPKLAILYSYSCKFQNFALLENLTKVATSSDLMTDRVVFGLVQPCRNGAFAHFCDWNTFDFE